MTRLSLVIFLSLLMPAAPAGDGMLWHHKKCAVCLTYDDALNVHLDNVVPLLDSLGLRATFYITGSSSAFRSRLPEWKSVADSGNELGNHTLFHPCEGRAPGREWVRPEYDLNGYTATRMADELDMTNVLLRVIDGKERRTFAYPCGDTTVGGASFVAEIKARFVAARGVEGKMQTIGEIDPYNVGTFMINGQSGDELVGLVRKALERNALLVFLFHGVGGEHDINVSLAAHSQLLHFLKQNENEIWVAPMIDIAGYLQTR